jgi:hypothetical protein
MPLPVTCACGAKFDAEEALAGKEMPCPDCQEPVSIPAVDRQPRRTSMLALWSAILALVGAFTVLGTLIASVLGLAGLIHVSRNRERIAGAGLATFGLVAGIVFTGLTLFALSSKELFGLGSPTRLGQLGDEVDVSGPLEVRVVDRGFSLTRPSVRWGKSLLNFVNDPIAGQLVDEPDLLLINPGRYLFVEARLEEGADSLDNCVPTLLAAMQTGNRELRALGNRNVRPTVRETKALPPAGWQERRELLVDVRCGSQAWTMLMRLQKSRNGEIYVTRAYTQRRRFAPAEAELREVLDSFHLLNER